MPDCTAPLWPCGMTGAVACLAGIPDLAVVIHGSSGCFFYPQSLLPVPLFSTFIHEREVIFGSLDRLARGPRFNPSLVPAGGRGDDLRPGHRR